MKSDKKHKTNIHILFLPPLNQKKAAKKRQMKKLLAEKWLLHRFEACVA